MPIHKMHSLWIGYGERRKKVHVISEADSKITVKVVTASRNKEGRLQYETFDSFEVGGATAEQVYATVKEAVLRSGRPAQVK